MIRYKTCKKIITLRKAEIADLNVLTSIESITYGNHGWSSNTFKNELENEFSHYIVGIVNSEIIGYAGYWMVLDEGHITNLAILPLYRNNHIADILIYNIIKNALENNIKWLTLEVRSKNTPAINLYKKFNFKIIGIRKKYYQDNNDDALILWTNDIKSSKYQDLIAEILNKDGVNIYADKCS